jgi:tetratricopeptide (TPR) repeat protein
MGSFAFRCLSILLLVGIGFLRAQPPDDFKKARAFYDRGSLGEAKASFLLAAQEDPQNAEAQYFLGIIALKDRDPASGAKYLEKAVELKPGTSEYLRRLGDAYADLTSKVNMFAALGVAEKTKHAYEGAVAADPTSLRAQWSLMEFCRIAPGIAGGDIARAYALADGIRVLEPKAGRWARAMVLLSDGNAEQAFALYDGALKADPADYAALFQLGDLSQQSRLHPDLGLEALQRCLKLQPVRFHPWFDNDDHARVYFEMGEIEAARGDTPAARTDYQAALALDKAFSEPRAALAKLGG